MSGGTCPNCEEELYIYETQYDDLPETLSDEFADTVTEQQAERKRRQADSTYTQEFDEFTDADPGL
jgi:hypothetical protein